MNVDQTLDQLCATYGVSASFGERLRPLLQRASTSPPEKRERLIGLVERSFAEEARRVAPSPKRIANQLSDAERTVLRTVADILHAWDPPARFKNWKPQSDSGKDAG